MSLPLRERGLKQFPMANSGTSTKSLPLRERGLKLCLAEYSRSHSVAPLAGAWIETTTCLKEIQKLIVAPLAGAWIETSMLPCVSPMPAVAPLAGAWIETKIRRGTYQARGVAPLAGAWIETRLLIFEKQGVDGRSPCGSVD